MSCGIGPGSSHHAACDCQEAEFATKLAEAEARAERYAAFIRKEAEANETCFRLDGREIHMRRAAYFRAALLPPPEPAGGEG